MRVRVFLMRAVSVVPVVAVLSFALVASLSSTACSSDDMSGAACSDYQPPAGFDANNPTKSFSKDVHPILKRSCATTSCHGASTNDGHVFISGDPATTYGAIVNVPSVKLPSMVYVKPSDPQNSFLMRKVDGSQCVLDKQCVGGTCGDSMPNKEAQLPQDERDTIRRWIAQGAKND